MAFEATHLRFAKDLAKVLKISDFDEYFAGSVYPDSRYITGVDRDLTHRKEVPTNPFKEGLSDFEKGWATHLLYDLEQVDALIKLSPYVNATEDTIGQYDDAWMFVTALKMVEDFESVKTFSDDMTILQNVSSKFAPNSEDKELLQKFYRIIHHLYRTDSPGIDDYLKMWRDLDVKTEIIDRLAETTNRVLSNEVLLLKIKKVYPKLLKETLL